ncbi:PQQ-binding-like beta-propeller repeat protein [Saccharibacillus sacchari]|uniref:PQQ-binding-like beta-propeller repeat protein n=1 Tax=Saccharibacillus sacchari TaxID=456493 RepID=A0ACC6PI93_9BACL
MTIKFSRFVAAGACLSAALLLSATGTSSAESAASSDSKAPLQKASSVQSLNPAWKVDNDGQGLFAKKSPISNGLVFFSDNRHTLYAAGLETGKVKWSIPQAGPPEVITSNTVTFIDASGRLVKVDSSSGKPLWRTTAVEETNEMGAHVYSVEGSLLVLNENSGGGLSAFDPVSGQRNWKNTQIPMYAGDLVGQYGGTLVVSSTVDNIRTRFFGIDPATGKQLWRQEGIYTPVGQANGQLILRNVTDQASRLAYGDTAFRGYMLRLAMLDPSTGKIVKTENYGLSQDARSSADPRAYLIGDYVYGVESSLSPYTSTLVRYKRGESASDKNYAEYGNLVSGPQNGYFFFQKNGMLSALRANDDRIFDLGQLPSSVATTGVHVLGDFAFAGLDTGEYYIFDMKSGRTWSMPQTRSHLFGVPFLKNGKLLVQTLSDLIVFDLPKG